MLIIGLVELALLDWHVYEGCFFQSLWRCYWQVATPIIYITWLTCSWKIAKVFEEVGDKL